MGSFVFQFYMISFSLYKTSPNSDLLISSVFLLECGSKER